MSLQATVSSRGEVVDSSINCSEAFFGVVTFDSLGGREAYAVYEERWT
jgi:hypothetical protein